MLTTDLHFFDFIKINDFEHANVPFLIIDLMHNVVVMNVTHKEKLNVNIRKSVFLKT